MTDDFSLSCPAPAPSEETIQLAHGGGGTLMHRLLNEVFFPAFGSKDHDGAVFPVAAGSLAFSTDSYVVRPLEFPGGNIGDLAINGTVNDLAMCGATPTYLSVGFILEEGLPFATLKRIVTSMKIAAAEAGVQVVTGDTKVVDRGKGDGVYINTSGIGVVAHGVNIGPEQIEEDDAVIVSGDLGRHGIAIMAVREGLEFETTIESDCAPLIAPVHALLDAGIAVRCLRDLTRGGLASGLVEIAQTAKRRIGIDLRFRSRTACAAPAKSSGWIRYTWPTKADSSPWWQRRMRSMRLRCCDDTTCPPALLSLAGLEQKQMGWSPRAVKSEPPASSIC